MIREAKRLGKAPGVAPRTGEAALPRLRHRMVAQNDHHAALHNLLLANPFGQQLSSRSPFHREGVALPIATVRAAELAFKLRQALATSAWRDSFGRSPLLGSTGRQKLVKIGARIVRHGRYVVFQLAEVAVPRMLFAAILRRIERLRPRPLLT